MKYLILIITLITCSMLHAKEIQYVCEFNVQVKSGNYSSGNPSPRVTKNKERYTFFYDGKNASYVNLAFGNKNPAIVFINSSTINFIEKNTADNFFIVTIFPEKKTYGSNVAAIYSFLAYGEKPDMYDPYQSFGSCWITK